MIGQTIRIVKVVSEVKSINFQVFFDNLITVLVYCIALAVMKHEKECFFYKFGDLFFILNARSTIRGSVLAFEQFNPEE